jgi:hypothetical protein
VYRLGAKKFNHGQICRNVLERSIVVALSRRNLQVSSSLDDVYHAYPVHTTNTTKYTKLRVRHFTTSGVFLIQSGVPEYTHKFRALSDCPFVNSDLSERTLDALAEE